MNLLKKASVVVAAASMAVASVAASAAPQVDSIRADTVVEGEAVGAETYLLGLLALFLLIFGGIELFDDSDNSPTSP